MEIEKVKEAIAAFEHIKTVDENGYQTAMQIFRWVGKLPALIDSMDWKLELEFDDSEQKSSSSKRANNNNSGQSENKERGVWGSLPNDEKYVIAEKMREYYKLNPTVKMSVLADMFAKDMGMAASTPSHIISYWQLKPSLVENPDYSFFGLPNDFFPADAPLPFEENYKGDSNYQYSKVGNLGKYGNFADRPAKIQAEMRAAKIENRPINFKV